MQLPKWCQVSENDLMVPPDVECMFAKQMNAITISLASSHASLVSHPNEIARLILNAANGSSSNERYLKNYFRKNCPISSRCIRLRLNFNTGHKDRTKT
jgi:hypothetical protein